MTEPHQPLHSAEYFGESRDYWWNRDYLELRFGRWGLGSARRVLDIGCGVGHWGRLVGSLLHPDATILGIDREPAWVTRAAEIAQERGLTPRHTYAQGLADALTFPNGSFDLVTC